MPQQQADKAEPFGNLAAPERLYGMKVESVQELRANPRRVVPDLMRLHAACKIPVTLWGPVGSRKTRTIQAFARETDSNDRPYKVVTIQPSTEDPTVIHGIMYTSLNQEGETVMRRSFPEVAKEIVAYGEEGGYTVLFADEMTTCMPAQQHSLLGLLTHGTYGPLDINPYMTMVMAANPEGTVSTVNPLGEQVINRGGHLAWYGDVDLFLEEWGSGFNGATTRPDPEVLWTISELLDSDRRNAFRSERWKPEELVPYDLMEHSERVVTDLAVLVERINRTFAARPTPIRHFYLVEAARALLGPEWATNMAKVLSREEERMDGIVIKNRVAGVGVDHTWTEERLRTELGTDRMYTYEARAGRSSLVQDQVTAIADSLLDQVGELPQIDYSAMLSLWAFATLAPDGSVQASLYPHLIRLLNKAARAVQTEVITKEQAMPTFVPVELQRAVLNLHRTLATQAN